MFFQIPSTMKALVGSAGQPLVVKTDVPVPTLETNQVLIKVEYAAQNPVDAVLADYSAPPNSLFGCDFSGTVVSLGSSLRVPLEKGDKVAGFVLGATRAGTGSFAQFVSADSDLVFKVPKELSLVDASQFGVAFFAAVQAIIFSQGKQWPTGQSQVPAGTWIFINGGSTTVGVFAIQIAKRLGYKVITTCSPHNVDVVKSYGADETVDYHDAEKCQAEIKRITGGGVSIGLDPIADDKTLPLSVGAFSSKGGKLNVMRPLSDDAKKLSQNVELVYTSALMLLGKSLVFFGQEIGADAPSHTIGLDIFKHIPELIQQGLKVQASQVLGGLEEVPNGLKLSKEGKVSAKKLVYKID